MGEDDHARRISANAGAVIRGATEVLGDEDIQHLLEAGVVQRLRAVPAAPLMATVVDAAVEGRHHQALLDSSLRGVARLLDDNRALMRQKLAEQSPWWVPEPIDDRLFRKLFDGIQGFLREILGDPNHEVRHQLDAPDRRPGGPAADRSGDDRPWGGAQDRAAGPS